MDEAFLPSILRKLLEKGVRIPHPRSVEVGDEVSPDRISGRGVVLHGGVRLHGAKTLLCEGVTLGAGGPAVVEDCLLGAGVALEGGSFRGSIFLAGAAMGPSAHVREGCLLEEESSGAHAVGLKQTILFPFVTLGSLVNFCDCLMAGGTSRRNHSEVGSSFIHFNYTPGQDKATASLIGDVPRGVMLDQTPIFLGGQGGIAGPVRLDFGTVLPAGTVCRQDVPGETGESGRDRGGFSRKVWNNLVYLANLAALECWYRHVRSRFFPSGSLEGELHKGALTVLAGATDERIRRLGEFAERLPPGDDVLGTGDVPALPRHQFRQKWPEAEGAFREEAERDGDEALRDRFLHLVDRAGAGSAGSDGSGGYLSFVRELDPAGRRLGTAWLQSIVDSRMERVLAVLTAFRAHPREGS